MAALSRHAESLAATVGKALTEGAFLVTFPVDDAGTLPAPTLDVEVDIHAEGQPSLRLELSLPLALAREMAANVLGEMDPDAVSAEDVENATLELANVVAGGFARHAFDGLCRILPPRRCAEGRSPLAVAFTLGTDAGASLRVGLGAVHA